MAEIFLVEPSDPLDGALASPGESLTALTGTAGHAQGEQDGRSGSRGPRRTRRLTCRQTSRPDGGKLLAEISTTIVAIQREHYGRGPMKAKTYALDDIVVCVMRRERLHRAREDDHGQRRSRAASSRCATTSSASWPGATATGSRISPAATVIAFLSQAHVDPDITVEIFFVDRPFEGFGAVEIVAPGAEPRPQRTSPPSARASLQRGPRRCARGVMGCRARRGCSAPRGSSGG